MPLERESISAMPMMPMLPAKAVSMVRPFFVIRLLSERLRAVRKDMLGRFLPSFERWTAFEPSYGSESPTISPSSRRTMRVA